jgi:hypothetical protein
VAFSKVPYSERERSSHKERIISLRERHTNHTTLSLSLPNPNHHQPLKNRFIGLDKRRICRSFLSIIALDPLATFLHQSVIPPSPYSSSTKGFFTV